MKILTVCNHKGGTGKTTSAIHIAAALGLTGYRTLVIDLDPQGFLTRMLGLQEPVPEASSLVLFDHTTKLQAVAKQHMKGFDLLPASTLLTKSMRRLHQPSDVLWVKEALEGLVDYDVVLLDTAAAITVYSLNALVASRFVLIPVTPEYQPVLGSEQTYQTVMMVRDKLNPDLMPPIFLFTQVDGRKRNHHAYRRYLRKKYGDQVLSSIIRTSAALAVSHEDGSTVFDHEPHSRGARDYANTTDELIRLMQGEQPGGAEPAPDRMPAEVIALASRFQP